MAVMRPSSLIWLLALILFGLAFGKLLRRAYLTPLASIPGPWHAKFTSLWLTQNIVKGRRMQYIHRLHQIFGPVVRIAPTEVDVSDLEGYNAIHKIGNGFLKSQWYPRFRTAGRHQDVFSERDPKGHAFKRKLLSRPFSKTNLRENWEHVVRDKAESAVKKIRMEAEIGTSDVFQWRTFYTMDVIGHIAFGKSFGMLELGRKTEFVQIFEATGLIGILRAELPLFYNLISTIPNFIYDIEGDEKLILQYGREAINSAKDGLVDKTNIFTGFITAQEKQDWVPEDAIVTEATGLIGAGGGTTAVTLTYLVWAILSNPQMQRRLESEVETLAPDFTDTQLEALPYLNAVIQETLRVHGAIPSSLPRIAPEAGLHTCGYFIPEGTTVCTQSYTLHRDPNTFQYPERFDPERFLEPEHRRLEQKSAFAAFGAGARTCLGIHLAYMELRLAVAIFFRDCAGACLAPASDDAMDMINFFGAMPKKRFCGINLMRESLKAPEMK